MTTTLAINTFAAVAAALGVSLASFTGTSSDAYGDGEVDRLTRAELAQNAWAEFERADIDGDKYISVDEFAALAVAKAELAHLNGFIAIEVNDNVQTIGLPITAPQALNPSEHTRIDAVARYSFYAFAGADGKMDADDYISMNAAYFDLADRNNNQALTKTELTTFASSHAGISAGV